MGKKKTKKDIPKEYRLAKKLPKDVRYYYETKVGIPDETQNHLELFSPGIVSHLFKIMHSCSDNTKKAKDVEKYLSPFGFKMLGEGTNIVVLVNDLYPGVVFKIALDPYGIADNFNDLNFQEFIPRYARVFARDHSCIVTVQERYYVMDLDLIGYYREPIIKYLNKLKDKYLIADLSPRNLLNYGIDRKGKFVVIDGSDLFPLSQMKGKELRCNRLVKLGKKGKPDVLCGGKISYNEDFSECTCKKCKRTVIPIMLRPRKEVENLSRMLLDGTTEEERAEMNRKAKAAIKARLAAEAADPKFREEQNKKMSVESVEIPYDESLEIELDLGDEDEEISTTVETVKEVKVTKEKPKPFKFNFFKNKKTEGKDIPDESILEEEDVDIDDEPEEEVEVDSLADDPIVTKTIIRSKAKKVEHDEPLVVKVHETEQDHSEPDVEEEDQIEEAKPQSKEEVVMQLFQKFSELGSDVKVHFNDEAFLMDNQEEPEVEDQEDPEEYEDDEEEKAPRGEDGFIHLNIREALAKKRESRGEPIRKAVIPVVVSESTDGDEDDMDDIIIPETEPEVATQETVQEAVDTQEQENEQSMTPGFKLKLQQLQEDAPMRFRNYIKEVIDTVGIEYMEDVIAELKGLSAEDVIEVETDHVESEDFNNDILDPNDARIDFEVVTIQNRSSDELPGIYYHFKGDFDKAYQKCGIPIYVTSDKVGPEATVLALGSAPDLRDVLEDAYHELMGINDTTIREPVDEDDDDEEFGLDYDQQMSNYHNEDIDDEDDEFEPSWAKKAREYEDELDEEDTSSKDDSDKNERSNQ